MISISTPRRVYSTASPTTSGSPGRYGGLVLNWIAGGLNPHAVDASIKMGGRMVWMPTLSAQHHIGFFGGSHFGRSMKMLRTMVVSNPARLLRLD